jgi:murein DD-endopeptidase MepM/ murein hydrolase activator NlpD
MYCPIIGAEFGDGWGAGRGHQGVDLLIGVGHAIHAVETGVIVKQGFQSNGALVITQQATSGAVYFYGHNSRNLVVAGQHVVAGQVIAISGETGTVGAPHLHFERRPGLPGDKWYHASPTDPVPFTKSICL